MCLIDDCGDPARRAVLAGAAGLALTGLAGKAEAQHDRAERFSRGKQRLNAYIATPATPGPATAVIVLHGNAGLPIALTRTADRLARAGFVGVAIDPTSREPDPSKIPPALLRGRAFGDRYVADARSVLETLRRQKVASAGLVGAWGFCGGGYTALLWGAGEHGSEIGAFVGPHVGLPNRGPDGSFSRSRPHGLHLYGASPFPAQFHFGEEDGLTPGADISALQQLAQTDGRILESFIYPKARHGFSMEGDTNYIPDAAEQVLRRGIEFMRKHLG